MTEEHARRFARSMAFIRGLRCEDVNDAEQDAVIKWLHVRDRHDGYQKQVVSNAVSDYTRNRMRRGMHLAVTYEDIYEPIDSHDAYAEVDDRAEWHDQITRLLAFCRKEEREVVVLLLMGLTPEQGAAVMGISWSAYKTRLHRMRKRWHVVHGKSVR